MGLINTCTCKRSESEEELISIIFNTMKIRIIDVSLTYSDFLTCIVTEDNIEKIDTNFYTKFILRVINSCRYKNPQINYFHTLLKENDIRINGIKLIGVAVILLSDGSFTDKVSFLEKHFIKYYLDGNMDRNIKDLIIDVIEIHTEMCLISFKDLIHADSYKTLCIIWMKNMKQKLILKLMFIYEEIKHRHNEENLSNEKTSLLNRFLSNVYNNLTGENVRSYLYERYISDNDKISFN